MSVTALNARKQTVFFNIPTSQKLVKLAKCAEEFFGSLVEFFGNQNVDSAQPAQNKPAQFAKRSEPFSDDDESAEGHKSPPVHKVIRKIEKPSEKHEESKANKEHGSPKKPRNAFILFNKEKMQEQKGEHCFSIFPNI